MANKPTVDSSTVEKIARLARIQVSQQQRTQAAAELVGILDWVRQLDEVDTTGVPPMTSVAEMSLPMRRDAVTDGSPREHLLSNSPTRADAQHFFAVPKVVE